MVRATAGHRMRGFQIKMASEKLFTCVFFNHGFIQRKQRKYVALVEKLTCKYILYFYTVMSVQTSETTVWTTVIIDYILNSC